MSVYDEMSSFFDEMEEPMKTTTGSVPAAAPSQVSQIDDIFNTPAGVVSVGNKCDVADPLGITASTQIVPPSVPIDTAVPIVTPSVLSSTSGSVLTNDIISSCPVVVPVSSIPIASSDNNIPVAVPQVVDPAIVSSVISQMTPSSVDVSSAVGAGVAVAMHAAPVPVDVVAPVSAGVAVAMTAAPVPVDVVAPVSAGVAVAMTAAPAPVDVGAGVAVAMHAAPVPVDVAAPVSAGVAVAMTAAPVPVDVAAPVSAGVAVAMTAAPAPVDVGAGVAVAMHAAPVPVDVAAPVSAGVAVAMTAAPVPTDVSMPADSVMPAPSQSGGVKMMTEAMGQPTASEIVLRSQVVSASPTVTTGSPVVGHTPAAQMDTSIPTAGLPVASQVLPAAPVQAESGLTTGAGLASESPALYSAAATENISIVSAGVPSAAPSAAAPQTDISRAGVTSESSCSAVMSEAVATHTSAECNNSLSSPLAATTTTATQGPAEDPKKYVLVIEQLTETIQSLHGHLLHQQHTLLQHQQQLQHNQQQLTVHEMHIKKQNQILTAQANENSQLHSGIRSLQTEIKQRFHSINGSLKDVLDALPRQRIPQVASPAVAMHAESLASSPSVQSSSSQAGLDTQVDCSDINGEFGLRSALKKSTKSPTGSGGSPSSATLDQSAIAALVDDPNMCQDEKDRLIAEQLQRMYDQEDAQTANQQVQQHLQVQHQPTRTPQAPAATGSAKKPALGGWMKNLFGMPAPNNSGPA